MAAASNEAQNLKALLFAINPNWFQSSKGVTPNNATYSNIDYPREAKEQLVSIIVKEGITNDIQITNITYDDDDYFHISYVKKRVV